MARLLLRCARVAPMVYPWSLGCALQLDTAVSLLRCSDDGKKTLVKEGFLPPAIGLLR